MREKMKELKHDKIEKPDLDKFLKEYFDFSFEISVLKLLKVKNLECEHGGLYDDHITGKSRQFDIRAMKTIDDCRVRLSIECKNIKEYFPVLISCMPRRDTESFHNIATVGEPCNNGSFSVPALKSRVQVLRLEGKDSIYKPKDPVGKSINQVGKAKSSDEIIAHDKELYDIWSQCLSSAHDLVDRTYWDQNYGDASYMHSTIFPIVVIPNERLWIVEFDFDGNIETEPEQVSRCSFFINRNYKMGTNATWENFKISHMEIMTCDGLKSFIEEYLESPEGISKFFPLSGIIKAYNKHGNS